MRSDRRSRVFNNGAPTFVAAKAHRGDLSLNHRPILCDDGERGLEYHTQQQHPQHAAPSHAERRL